MLNIRMSNILYVRSYMLVISIYLIIYFYDNMNCNMEIILKNFVNEWLKEIKNDCFLEIFLFFK